MRLDINLASQPYEDARQFWMRWGTATIAVAFLTLILLTMTARGWVYARQDRQAMAETRALIADRDRIRANAEAFLNRPENRNTRDTSQFLNEMIERKAFLDACTGKPGDGDAGASAPGWDQSAVE